MGHHHEAKAAMDALNRKEIKYASSPYPKCLIVDVDQGTHYRCFVGGGSAL